MRPKICDYDTQSSRRRSDQSGTVFIALCYKDYDKRHQDPRQKNHQSGRRKNESGNANEAFAKYKTRKSLKNKVFMNQQDRKRQGEITPKEVE